MKYLVVGDLQVHGSEPDFYGNHRLGYTNRTVDWIISVLLEENPDVFVHMGDLGEDNTGVSTPSLSTICRFMEAVDGSGVPSYWLVGNHDYFTKDGSVNLMTALGHLTPDSCHIVWPFHQPINSNALYISYTTQDKFMEALEQHPSEVLFCHQPIAGSYFGHGMFDPDGVDPKLLPPLTIVGHYHHANIVGDDERSLLYTGSPMSVNYSDNLVGCHLKRRGIWVCDIKDNTEDSSITMVENPFTEYYATVRANDIEELDKQLEGASRSNLHLRVITDVDLPLDEDHYASLSILKDKKQKAVQRSNISLDTSPDDSVKDYVDYKSPPQDMDMLKAVGLKLLKGVDPWTVPSSS